MGKPTRKTSLFFDELAFQHDHERDMKGPLNQLGQYRIIEKVASGGMACVYRAERKEGQDRSQEVALKILHPHLCDDPDYVSMFHDESELCTRFDHGNLIRVFDHGTIDGYRYMAMAYCSGVTLAVLSDKLAEAGIKLELPWVVYVLRQTLAGLEFAHNLCNERGDVLGIVHRDISPDNILLTTDGVIKVLDFGVATATKPRPLSAIGVVKGKVDYMAPEQAAGKRVDPRSDIYAVGVLGYELLTGKRLSGEGSTEARRQRVANAPEVILSEDGCVWPSRLRLALTRALRRDPGERFPTASDFSDEMDKVLADLKWDGDVTLLGKMSAQAMKGDIKPIPVAKKKRARKPKKKSQRMESGTTHTGQQTYRERLSRAGSVVHTIDETTVQWMAWMAMGLFSVGILFELFGVSFPVAGVEEGMATAEPSQVSPPLPAPLAPAPASAPPTSGQQVP